MDVPKGRTARPNLVGQKAVATALRRKTISRCDAFNMFCFVPIPILVHGGPGGRKGDCAFPGSRATVAVVGAMRSFASLPCRQGKEERHTTGSVARLMSLVRDVCGTAQSSDVHAVLYLAKLSTPARISSSLDQTNLELTFFSGCPQMVEDLPLLRGDEIQSFCRSSFLTCTRISSPPH
jgi:hypothetical protein